MNAQPKGSEIVERAKTLPGDLPANYEAAKKQMAVLSKVDECKDWADKAAALASYAKQSDDKTLMNYAMKIKARAIQRCGELLRQYDDRQHAETRKSKKADDHHSTLSQAEAGEAAGMSPHQIKEAVRVAKVPKEEFERQVESDNPPTITQLAEQGKTSRASDVTLPVNSAKPGFLTATYLTGALKRVEDLIEGKTPAFVTDAMTAAEIKKMRVRAIVVRDWLNIFIEETGGADAIS